MTRKYFPRKPPKTVKELLKAARHLLSDYSRWHTGSNAADKNGNRVMPKSKRAVCWCAVGALSAVGKGFIISEAATLLDKLVSEYIRKPDPEITDIVSLNDFSSSRRNYQRVLRVFDKAIKRAA